MQDEPLCDDFENGFSNKNKQEKDFSFFLEQNPNISHVIHQKKRVKDRSSNLAENERQT